MVDLEISIEYTDQLYVPLVLLNKNKVDDKDLSDKGLQKAKMKEVKPIEVETEIKNYVMYRYVDLKKGEYDLVLI